MKDLLQTYHMGINVINNSGDAQNDFVYEPELFYVLDGCIQVCLDDKVIELQKGDIYVINIGSRYTISGTAGFTALKVVIAVKLLRGEGVLATPYISCSPAGNNRDSYEHLKKIIRRMLDKQLAFSKNRESRENMMQYISLYFEMLYYIATAFMAKTLPANKRTDDEERRKIIVSYIQENYREAISLKDMAKALFLSEGYLSRYFKETFGKSFTDYVKEIRLSKAMEDVLFDDKPITQVAFDNGFTSLTFFNRAFKEYYGELAVVIRKRKEGERKHQEDFVFKNNEVKSLEKYLESVKIDEGKREVLKAEFSVRNTVPTKRTWTQVINIGGAPDLLNSGIQEHVFILKEALEFRYVRFWNILSPDLHIDINKTGEKYNFSKLDRVFDFIIGEGLLPFIDFEEKGNRINACVEEKIYDDKPDIIFNTTEHLRSFIREFVQHYLRRYGSECMSQWKFEIWFNGYHINGLDNLKNYFTMFSIIYKEIKAEVPGMMIGGPGSFADAEYLGRDFWNGWKRSAPSPDFISMMNYGYEVDNEYNRGYTARTYDTEFLKHDIQKKKQFLRNMGVDVNNIYLTEYNITLSDRNYINDSSFHGAAIVKTIIDSYGHADIMAHMYGSDRVSEYYDSGGLLFGAKGLLSRDSILKPSAFALYFFNHTYKNYIGKTGNAFVTCEDGKYAVLCHNMKKLSRQYFNTEENKMQKEEMTQYFQDNDPIDISLVLKDVDNGSYKVDVQSISKDNGSILDVWQSIGFYSEINRQDLKTLRKICQPRMTLKRCDASQHRLEMNIHLEGNEIQLLTIEKI